VRVVRASYRDLVIACNRLEQGSSLSQIGELLGASDDRTPAFGTRLPGGAGTPVGRVPNRGTRAGPSGPPIPLVKRTGAPPPSRNSRIPTDPGVGLDRRPVYLPESDDRGEPVIGLRRSKIPESASGAMHDASSPAELVQGLVGAAAEHAQRVAAFAVREGAFEGMAAAGMVAGSDVRRLREAASSTSVLASALLAGYYLGPLKQTPVELALAELLGMTPGEEVYAVPVFVSGRAAVIVVVAGFDTPLETTRRIDELVRAAGTVLENMLRHRKRKP
jgi:hypothetical protein